MESWIYESGFQLEVRGEGIDLEVMCTEMIFPRWDQATSPRKSYIGREGEEFLQQPNI